MHCDHSRYLRKASAKLILYFDVTTLNFAVDGRVLCGKFYVSHAGRSKFIQ